MHDRVQSEATTWNLMRPSLRFSVLVNISVFSSCHGTIVMTRQCCCRPSPGTTDRTGWAAPSGGCGWSRLSVQHSWTPHVNLTWIWPDIKLCDTNPSIRSLNCSKLASEARNSSLSFSDWPGRYNHLTHWPLTYLQKIFMSANWWHNLVTCEDVTVVVVHLDIRLGTHSVSAEDRDGLTNCDIMGN